MKGILATILGGMMALLLIGISPDQGIGAKKEKAFPEVPRITAKELQSMLDRKDLLILDVRPLFQWEESRDKIQGALHEDPTKVDSWSHKYPKEDTVIVTY